MTSAADSSFDARLKFMESYWYTAWQAFESANLCDTEEVVVLCDKRDESGRNFSGLFFGNEFRSGDGVAVASHLERGLIARLLKTVWPEAKATVSELETPRHEQRRIWLLVIASGGCQLRHAGFPMEKQNAAEKRL